MDDLLPEKKYEESHISDEDDLQNPTKHDRTVLEEEDEEQQEKLLTTSSTQSGRSVGNDEAPFNQSRKIRKKERRRLRRGKRKEKGTTDEEGKLMYEMEEGGSLDNLSSLSSSSEELEKLKYQPSKTSPVGLSQTGGRHQFTNSQSLANFSSCSGGG